MADNTEIESSKEDPKTPRNLFSLFPKFKLEFPFLKPGPKAEVGVKEEVKREIVVGGNEGEEGMVEKPDVVKFAERKAFAPPPLVVEAEESSAKTSNPVILWQVYALGGFLVLRWMWARWQERTKKGPSDNENDEPSDVE
ncbi:uncharacterized protein LOC132163252 [Corylus avellana]|uniref:uncharacterized protein LOC132163252 n=1 Tax=Corylus avellana TaxID=13451 RepID=UPI00286A61F1|nr:uncharacterized protein LOC132163252 [Corylus avellana]